jgi:hypothetical protein
MIRSVIERLLQWPAARLDATAGTGRRLDLTRMEKRLGVERDDETKIVEQRRVTPTVDGHILGVDVRPGHSKQKTSRSVRDVPGRTPRR